MIVKVICHKYWKYNSQIRNKMGKMGKITILELGKSFRRIYLSSYRKNSLRNISKI